MAGTPTGFAFTETMGGHVAADSGSYRNATRRGRKNAESLRFKVTIAIPDLPAFLKDPTHSAEMTGTVDSSKLGTGLAVEAGTFNLLERTDSGRLRMGYVLKFKSSEGEAYVLEGFKDVHNDRVIDVWYDTTALFTTLRRGEAEADAEPLRGILRIRLIDLAFQVLSMRNPNGQGILGHIRGLLRFNWFFSFTLAREYARPPRRGQGDSTS